MPIYEYKCLSCNLNFEKLVFNDKEEITCPECKKDTIKRLFSRFGVNIVGGGSYSYSSNVSSCSSCTARSCSTCK